MATLPEGMVLEGAGDCIWDRARRWFWLGYGPRSDLESRRLVEDIFGVEVVALALPDPRFYHLDTALCPLPRGEVIYFPDAFAANAVAIGDTIVLSGCSDTLSRRLAERGYQIVATPLDGFLRSDGSAFCLTLRLDHASTAEAPPRQALADSSTDR